jgi:hypothetical protein
MKTKTIMRQGDVLMVYVGDGETDGEQVPPDERGIVLAEGETSGHYHRVFGRGHKLFQLRGSEHRMLVVGMAGAEVRVVGGEAGGVPRHEPVNLSPGRWEIRLQRSWTSAGYAARVED